MDIIEAIKAIEELPDVLRNEFSSALESAKDEFMADINVVNKSLLDTIYRVKEESIVATGVVKMDVVKAIIDVERQLSETTTSLENKISIEAQNIRKSAIELVQLELIEADISKKVADELIKQITWANLFKILFGRKL